VTDALGFFVVETSSGQKPLEISRRGFRKTIAAAGDNAYPSIRLDSYFESLEPGIVLTVDAAGGGEETGWVGPTGVKASDLNLALARRLTGLFSSAGIGVRLTRETDHKVGPEQRVIASESAGSTLLISLAHSEIEAGRVTIGHFPGSSGGNRLSVNLADEIGRLPQYETQVTEIAEYLIQQTSCPAVKVDFPVGSGVEDELDLTEALNTWKRAYAIFYATLRYLGIEEDATFSVSGRVTADDRPLGGALVLVDGSLELLSDDDGKFSVKMLEEGNHIAEAFSGTQRSAPVVFDQDSDELRLNLD
jgi:N-acetylmuramoyl-L-alanine amidase